MQPAWPNAGGAQAACTVYADGWSSGRASAGAPSAQDRVNPTANASGSITFFWSVSEVIVCAAPGPYRLFRPELEVCELTCSARASGHEIVTAWSPERHFAKGGHSR